MLKKVVQHLAPVFRRASFSTNAGTQSLDSSTSSVFKAGPPAAFNTSRTRRTFLAASSETPLQAATRGLGQNQQVQVTNFALEDKGLAVLRGDIFDVPIRPDIIHSVVRWQLNKRRQGTHSTKRIHFVSGSGRKPWPQKGQGRARAGSLRAPHMRGGATMHGPLPRSHATSLPKQVRRLGLKVALSARMSEGKLLVFDTITPTTGKTREIERFVQGLKGAKRVLFVDGEDSSNELLLRAVANLYEANVLPHGGLNVYNILQHDTLIMGLEAVRKIEERLCTPIKR